MTTRRTFLASGATGALLLSGGCLGFVTGSEPLEFSADKAAPTAEALEETGYVERGADWQTIEETVELGVEREVKATLWTGTYTKGVALQGSQVDAAVFAVVSMPAMEILGTSFNPLEEMDSGELLEEALKNFEGERGNVRDITHERTKQVTILGESRTVDVFSATTDVEGQELEVTLSVAFVDHEDDFLLLVGSHPRMLADEEFNVEILLESIEHPVQ